MTDFGRRAGVGDMLKADYDPDEDGLVTAAEAHKASHQNGGADEIDCTGLTGTGGAGILGDGTVGRVFRHSRLFIRNGTTGNTIKCRLLDRWNGDVIDETDNIPIAGSAGHFSLDAGADDLTIAVAGLSGNVLSAHAIVYLNQSQVHLTVDAYPSNGDLVINLFDALTGSIQIITDLVNTGQIYVNFQYITDA